MKLQTKKTLLITTVFLALFNCIDAQQTSQKAWSNTYTAILKKINAPKFKNKSYTILDFGAVANDTSILNTESINRAVAVCSTNGGGTVVIPSGVWFTAPITMKSNVNLHLEEGSTLLFTTNPKYFSTVITRWEGLDCYNLQPLIYAYGETNIAITGKGIIDGGSSNDNWWKKCGAASFGWKEGDISQRIGRPKIMNWANEKYPISKRILTENDGMRPQTINFYLCKNILIEGVKLIRSPFWVIHPLMSDNITIRNVHIENDGPNGDGCDPESCTNVLIENCFFNTGDDCIAIKSGRNNDGRFWNKPSENIIVRNCEMKNGHGGVVIGSEISGGYKNLFVENCYMNSPELDRAIRIKTSNLRGGTIENIYVRNLKIGQCKEAVLRINLNYEANEIGKRDFPPMVKNVYLENVKCEKSKYGIYIDALNDKVCVENINVINSNFEGVQTDKNNISGKVNNIQFKNLKINGKMTVK